MKKICSQCKIQKETLDYDFNAYHQAYIAECKDCHRKRIKLNNKKNRDKYRPAQRKWAQENKEKRRLQSQEWHKKNPDKVRNSDLKGKYGITLDEYNKMQIYQNYTCAICKKPEIAFDKKANKIRSLAVDHCHTTGKVRELLCQSCNQGMGLLKENTTTLQNMIDYIKKHNIESRTMIDLTHKFSNKKEMNNGLE